jgi:hypothetical protein
LSGSARRARAFADFIGFALICDERDPSIFVNAAKLSSSRTEENFEATCYASLILINLSESTRRRLLCAITVS